MFFDHFKSIFLCISPDHPSVSRLRVAAGRVTESYFHFKGSLAYIDEAISYYSNTVESTPVDHPERINIFSELNSALHSRGLVLWEGTDFAYIKQIADEVPETSQYGGIDIPLGIRGQTNIPLRVLDEAIYTVQQAISSTVLDQKQFSEAALRLSQLYKQRFDQIHSIKDLRQAIDSGIEALRNPSLVTTSRIRHYAWLGTCFGDLYENTGSIEALNLAIEYVDTAWQFLGEDSLPFSTAIICLGPLAHIRHLECQRIGTLEPFQPVIQTIMWFLETDHNPSLILAEVCRVAGLASAYISQWEDAEKLLCYGIQCFPQQELTYAFLKMSINNA